MDVLTLNDDVAQIDADPEDDPLIFGGRDNARKLDKQTVASGLDDAAFVLGDLWIDQFAPMRPEPCEGAGFVLPHKAAVPGSIGGEDGREPALDPLSAQGSLLRRDSGSLSTRVLAVGLEMSRA